MLKKKLARQNPAFKASEKEHQRASKQNARNKPGVLAKECAEKKLARQTPTFKASERNISVLQSRMPEISQVC